MEIETIKNKNKSMINENPTKEIILEKEIFYISFIDNNTKIVVGMQNDIIEIYNSDLEQKLITINNQPSSYFTELSDKVIEKNIRKLKLLCCSYNYILKLFEIIIIDNNKVGFNLLHSFHPKESRNEINKAIELKNENKNIVSIDENNIIIYEYLDNENYFEIKKIQVEGANNIININEKLFCVSLNNKGIIQFYDSNNFELIKEIKNIEAYGCNDYICKLNQKYLFVGGFDYISILDINCMQLNTKIQLMKYKERITCSCPIKDKNILIVGTKYKNINDEFMYDIVLYKLDDNNCLSEIKRYSNAHDKIINAIIYYSGKIISCSEDKKIKIWNFINNEI